MSINRRIADAMTGNRTPNRNLLINGSFDIWQRGEQIPYTNVGVRQYTVDRFFVFSESSENTIEVSRHQATTPGMGNYVARITASGGGEFLVWSGDRTKLE